MKRVLALLISVILIFGITVTASAASVTATLSGVPSELEKDTSATITVNVSGSPTADSALVQITLGSGLELVSGEWKTGGIIEDFNVSEREGVMTVTTAKAFNDTVFSFVIKGKTVSSTAQSIKVDFTFKNGSSTVGTATASKTVKVSCVTHTYGTYTKNDNTNHTRTCSACGNVEQTNHTWNIGTQTKAPSCKETGVKTYTCTATGCGATKTETIAKTTNHTYGSWTTTKAATCTAAGTQTRTCSVCLGKETKTVDAIGHDYVNNQCQNCQEFLPLVVFKDYDGRTLNSEYYYLGDSITEPAAPSREADNAYTYTFVGWDKEITICNGDAIYTAVYESTPIEYTVVFKNYDGTVLSTKTYHYGDSITAPVNPTKTSDNTYTYTFAGWDKEITNCTGDTTYTATYTSNYIDYTVEFKNYDGTVLSSNTYHYGDKVTAPADPTKTADNTYTYAFAGWDKEITNCTGNTTYTATYTSNYIDYTVEFKNYDGTVLSTKTYHYGDSIIAPVNPTKTSDNTYTYTFAGWDKEITNCTGNTTYTATYTSNYIDYTVEFKNYDGTVLSSNTYHYGDKVTAPANPTKTADNTYTYAFAGWDKSVVNCIGDTTYTATYTSNYIDYTVEFKNYDGTVLSSNTYHYGDKVTAPADPTKTADNTYTYAFAGWDKSVVNCIGDTTYTATYTSNYIDYTVEFKNYDGTVLSSNTYHYGDTVIAPNTPTKPEDDEYTYSFAGWDSSVVACDGNKTYTATFNAIRKYVVGDIDGTEGVTDRDAVYLLYHTFLPDLYPVNQDCDFNGDNEVNDKDAIYLLYHTFLPDLYPIA